MKIYAYQLKNFPAVKVGYGDDPDQRMRGYCSTHGLRPDATSLQSWPVPADNAAQVERFIHKALPKHGFARIHGGPYTELFNTRGVQHDVFDVIEDLLDQSPIGTTGTRKAEEARREQAKWEAQGAKYNSLLDQIIKAEDALKEIGEAPSFASAQDQHPLKFWGPTIVTFVFLLGRAKEVDGGAIVFSLIFAFIVGGMVWTVWETKGDRKKYENAISAWETRCRPYNERIAKAKARLKTEFPEYFTSSAHDSDFEVVGAVYRRRREQH